MRLTLIVVSDKVRAPHYQDGRGAVDVMNGAVAQAEAGQRFSKGSRSGYDSLRRAPQTLMGFLSPESTYAERNLSLTVLKMIF